MYKKKLSSKIASISRLLMTSSDKSACSGCQIYQREVVWIDGSAFCLKCFHHEAGVVLMVMKVS